MYSLPFQEEKKTRPNKQTKKKKKKKKMKGRRNESKKDNEGEESGQESVLQSASRVTTITNANVDRAIQESRFLAFS